MEVKATAKYVRLSPTKARQVACHVRDKSVAEAEAILKIMPNKAAGEIYKVLHSAAANAEHNLELNRDELIVKAAYIDEGPVIKRIKCRARGRADRMEHRTSHITVVVGEREED